MKKILLSALTLGIAALNFAQSTTDLSVDVVSSPTGTVDANSMQTISVEVTNNDTITFDPSVTYFFSVSLDGSPVNDPNGGAPIWSTYQTVALAPGETRLFTLTQSWPVPNTPGNSQICVSLDGFLMSGVPGINLSSSKTSCSDIVILPAASVAELNYSNIKAYKSNDELVIEAMTSGTVRLMNVTGQVVNTFNVANGMNRFNTSALPKGIYFVVSEVNGKLTSEKIIL